MGQTPILEKNFYSNKKSIRCICLSKDGKKLFSGSIDGQIVIWDTSKLEIEDNIHYC